jgi:hypothetical protein
LVFACGNKEGEERRARKGRGDDERGEEGTASVGVDGRDVFRKLTNSLGVAGPPTPVW